MPLSSVDVEIIMSAADNTVSAQKPSERKAEGSSNAAGGLFCTIGSWTAQAAGRAATFVVAAGVVLVWAITDPIFHYSDTWQLVINTGTTIVTLPDGVPDPKFPEPRRCSDPSEAG